MDVIQDSVDLAQLIFLGNLSDFTLVDFIGFKQFLYDLKQNAAQVAQIRHVQIQIMEHQLLHQAHKFAIITGF